MCPAFVSSDLPHVHAQCMSDSHLEGVCMWARALCLCAVSCAFREDTVPVREHVLCGTVSRCL